MEFNIADLMECVADAVPEREAVVCDDERRTYAELDDARDPPRARAARRGRAGRRPRRPVPPQLRRAPRGDARLLQGARGSRQRQLPLRRRRARSTSATTPTSSRCSTTPTRARTSTRSAPPRCCSTVVAGSDEYEALVRSGSETRDFGPRSADDHYVLYTGGTTGRPKGVVWRQEDMFFGGLGQRESRRSADHRARADRGVGARQSRATAAAVPPARRHERHAVRVARARPAHARERAVVGTRHAARRRQGRALRRAPRRHGTRPRPARTRTCQRVQPRGRRERAPDAAGAHGRNPTAGTSRRCACSVRAAASCRAT